MRDSWRGRSPERVGVWENEKPNSSREACFPAALPSSPKLAYFVYLAGSTDLSTIYTKFICVLLWLSSVCWVIQLSSPGERDILATCVAIYFDSKLRELKLQTHQRISPAKVREKPPANVENGENEVWREGKFPTLGENAARKRRWTTFSGIYIPDKIGLFTSQATKNHFFYDNCRNSRFFRT